MWTVYIHQHTLPVAQTPARNMFAAGSTWNGARMRSKAGHSNAGSAKNLAHPDEIGCSQQNEGGPLDRARSRCRIPTLLSEPRPGILDHIIDGGDWCTWKVAVLETNGPDKQKAAGCMQR